jgi:hypothetical protein
MPALAGGLAALGGCALCVLLAGLWRRRRLQRVEAPKMIALARQNAKHPGVAEWDMLLHEMLFQTLQTADLMVRLLLLRATSWVSDVQGPSLCLVMGRVDSQHSLGGIGAAAHGDGHHGGGDGARGRREAIE